MLYSLKDCANLRIDHSTGSTALYVNYAQTSTMDFTSEQVFAKNKNVKAVRFDGNRESTFKTTMEVFAKDVIPLLFGKSYEKKSVDWAKREVLAVTSGSATLVGTPKTGTLQVFKVEEDDLLTHVAEQTVGTTTTANKYSLSGQTLTFNTTETFAEDGHIVCYYFVATQVDSFTVDNVTFPGGYVIYGDGALKGTDQEDEFVQFKLHNVKPQSNCSLTMDVNNICTLEILWDVMSDSKGEMMTWSTIV